MVSDFFFDNNMYQSSTISISINNRLELTLQVKRPLELFPKIENDKRTTFQRGILINAEDNKNALFITKGSENIDKYFCLYIIRNIQGSYYSIPILVCTKEHGPK